MFFAQNMIHILLIKNTTSQVNMSTKKKKKHYLRFCIFN